MVGSERHREENSSPRKVPPPRRKRGNAMPGESSGRLQCTKEGTVGKHIQGVETRQSQLTTDSDEGFELD